MSPWPFYVYALYGEDGAAAYVGKGSGHRLTQQRRRRGLPGREIVRFKREVDAYAFEREYIAEHKPALNRSPGGEGSWSALTVPRPMELARGMRVVGPRRYVARLLLSYAWAWPPSKLEEIRAVAYGDWA